MRRRIVLCTIVAAVLVLGTTGFLVIGVRSRSVSADSVVTEQFKDEKFIGNSFDRLPPPTPADQWTGTPDNSYLDTVGDPLTGAKPDVLNAAPGQSRVSLDAFRSAIAAYANDYAKRVDGVTEVDCRAGAEIEKQWGFAARAGRLICAVVIEGEFELDRPVDGKTFTFTRWVNYYDGLTGNQLGSSMYPGDNE